MLARAARKAGVKRCVITHVTSDIWRHTDDQIKACVDEGAYIEHCGVALLWGPGTGMPNFELTSAETMAHQNPHGRDGPEVFHEGREADHDRRLRGLCAFAR